jgi:hypothetical protein
MGEELAFHLESYTQELTRRERQAAAHPLDPVHAFLV